MIKVPNDLAAVMMANWREMRADIRELKAQMREISLQQRSEVAGSAPTYATSGDFPDVTVPGQWAYALDTNKMFFSNGTVWKEIATV